MSGWLIDPTNQDVITHPRYHEGDIQLQVDTSQFCVSNDDKYDNRTDNRILLTLQNTCLLF